MKKSALVILIMIVLCAMLPTVSNAASRADGTEIVELSKGIEQKPTDFGFVTYVNINELPESIARNFKRIGVASYSVKPDVSRFKWVDFITSNSLYDDANGYGSGLPPQGGTFYPLTVLYDGDSMPLAYNIGKIEFGGSSIDPGPAHPEPAKSLDHLEASEKEMVIASGQSQKLKVYAVYSNGEERDVTNNKEILVRSESASLVKFSKGTVTAGNKEGSTNLIITFQGKKLSIPVTVNKVAVKAIKASTTNTTLTVGEMKQIKVTGTLTDGKMKDLTNMCVWSTDDSDIADVDNGEIEAIAEGTTTITVNFNGFSAEIKVQVVPEEEEDITQYASLTASDKNIKLLPGDEKTLRIYGITEDGQKVEVTDEVLWQSSKSDVVDADSGILTANKPGKAIVYVSKGNTELSIQVEVIKEKAVKAIVSKPAKIELKKGSEKQLSAEVQYIDNVKMDITDRAEWSVKNNSIVEVDGGTVTALKKGKTIITVKYKGKFTNIEVNVK